MHTFSKLSALAFISFALLAATPAMADDAKTCPAAVTKAIDKAFPKATIAKCKAEKEDGQDQFEVKLTRADGSMAEVDVAPDGKILQVEEKIGVDKVPAAVMKSFAAKYPKAKVAAAEKQTPTTGTPSYELAFATDKGRKEATFTEDGKFVEEE